MKWVALILALWAAPLFAVQPDEVLDDAVLEDRARELSKGLRCPVCQNESIDESDAAIARDLRLLVRERLVAGDSDAEVIAYLVDRYGEFVLLEPDARGANLILWIAGPAVALMALIGVGLSFRRTPDPVDPLSADEAARLDALLTRDDAGEGLTQGRPSKAG